MSKQRVAEKNLEGWLYKKGPGVGRFIWRKRYFKQHNENLYYYKAEDAPVEFTLGYVSLDEAESVHPTLNSDKQFAFQINTQNRIYYLYCESEMELNYWITGLVRYIKNSGIEQQLDKEKKETNPELCSSSSSSR